MSKMSHPVRDLFEQSKENPGAIDLEEVVEYLDHEDWGQVREWALQTITHVSAADPDRLETVIEDVRPHLEDEFLVAQNTAALLFARQARHDPEPVRESVPELLELLDQDPPILRFRAAGALAPLLADHVDVFVPHTDRLVEVLVDSPTVTLVPDEGELEELEDETVELLQELANDREEQYERDRKRSQGVREFAANAIVEVAEIEPDQIAPHVRVLATTINDDRPIVRTALLDTMAIIAQDDPEAVQPAIEAIRARLNDEVDYVRAHAVRALGYGEATEAIEDLRELADQDVDENLRGLAADTADWLADSLEE
ncbi:HEAT repeat domain-containing protein [Natrialbaceae archaeon A-CW2]|uniref:HEAT repeat domain-containing protein n=1 Tax=Natronosalvus amylolyticus TaxID=2961994 RepID=UPI0020C95993|nr:HEAT repeat domain-containing protein [Natronosalvus amylolyticus]